MSREEVKEGETVKREWLKEIRKKNGMTQMQVAEAAGLSQSYYAGIEVGTRGKPLNANTAKRVAEVLKFDWERFFEET